IGYPESVKGYKLWYLEKGYKKYLINRDVVFNEGEFLGLKSTERSGDNNSTKIDSFEFDDNNSTKIDSFEFEVEPLELETTNETILGSKEESQEEHLEDDTTQDLQNYQLARDRVRRTVRPHDKYGSIDITTFALATTSEMMHF
ncbi:hypothetical protein PanWU01x14_223250, partial [Parasponia andersonii]